MSIHLSALVFTCFQKPCKKVLDLQVQKQNFMWNSHSRSFKVTYFGISGKPMRDAMTLYNKLIMLALSLEVPKTQPAKALKIAAVDNPRVIWRPLQETPTNICINLILQDTGVTGLHFCHLEYWFIFVQIFVLGSKKHIYFETSVCNGWSRSSTVVDFGTNRKCVCNLELAINSNLAPILQCFWDTATYWPKMPIFPTPYLTPLFNTLTWEEPSQISPRTLHCQNQSPYTIHW